MNDMNQDQSKTDGAAAVSSTPLVRRPWPDPTPEMLATPEFEAVWQCIKRWDINVPDVYGGYCGATGNHVRAILDALAALPNARGELPPPSDKR